MWGQVHFLTFQRTNDFIPVRRESHDLCCAHEDQVHLLDCESVHSPL